MKINNFLLSLVLIAAQPSMVFCAQNGQEVSSQQEEIRQETQPELSYWQMYAPQFMQDATSATSGYIATWIPQSVKNTVGNWSTKKQLAVLGAIVGVLATIGYNKEALMSLISNSYQEKFDQDVEKYKQYLIEYPHSISLQDTINTFRIGSDHNPVFIEAVKQLQLEGMIKY